VPVLPQRRCVGCGEHRPKPELIRVVRTPDGAVLIDRTGKQNGRGAYLCPNPTCLKRARRGGRLGQHLGCEIPEAVYDKLEQELTGNGNPD